jgi:hypothetical protein
VIGICSSLKECASAASRDFIAADTVRFGEVIRRAGIKG